VHIRARRHLYARMWWQCAAFCHVGLPLSLFTKAINYEKVIYNHEILHAGTYTDFSHIFAPLYQVFRKRRSHTRAETSNCSENIRRSVDRRPRCGPVYILL